MQTPYSTTEADGDRCSASLLFDGDSREPWIVEAELDRLPELPVSGAAPIREPLAVGRRA